MAYGAKPKIVYFEQWCCFRASGIIIVEDDLRFSPDFLEYFQAAVGDGLFMYCSA